MIHEEDVQATRDRFEQLTFLLNQQARRDGSSDDARPREQLFARDPDDPGDYAEADISAIWFGWRMHHSFTQAEAVFHAHVH